MCAVTVSIGCSCLFSGSAFGTLTLPSSLATSCLLNWAAVNTGSTGLVVSGMVLSLKSKKTVVFYLPKTGEVQTRPTFFQDMQCNHHMLFLVISTFSEVFSPLCDCVQYFLITLH